MQHSLAELHAAIAARPRQPSFPPAAERSAWTGFAGVARHRQVIDGVIALAEGHLGKPWSEVLASGYLAFSQTGDRVGYEAPYFARRDRLSLAAMAYALTADARFLRDAADGIWLVCDEATWCLPAHLGAALPQPEGAPLDLFACQTAQLLAEACALLAAPLAAYAPAVAQRARALVRQRITGPVLAGGHWWWMEGRNNWGPWCASGVAAAAQWCEEDPERFARILDSMLAVGRRFVAQYPEDGGCDEGVMYWTVATGALVGLLETATHATGLPMYGDAKLARMVRYPVAMRLGGGWFPAFADAGPHSGLPLGVCWRAAERTGCRDMQALISAEVASGSKPRPAGTGERLLSLLRWFHWTGDGAVPALPVDGEDWLPDLQVLVVRAGNTALAVKGGHNAENHNHNDVGQFIVHHAGQPVVVDAGRDTYTRQVFSDKRYDLWWTRGSGHAVPVVGGHEQLPGRERAARAVRCASDAAGAAFSADLAACYAAEAGIASLERTVRLDRSSGAVVVTDRISQARAQAVALALLTPQRPQTDGSALRLGSMRLEFDGLALAGTEAVEMPSGSILATTWNTGLWRIRLAGEVAREAGWRLRLSPL